MTQTLPPQAQLLLDHDQLVQLNIDYANKMRDMRVEAYMILEPSLYSDKREHLDAVEELASFFMNGPGEKTVKTNYGPMSIGDA